MNGQTYTLMLSVADQLRQARHGQHGEIKQRACDYLGVSVAHLHRLLAKVGYESGRKRRSDAGQTKVPAAALDLVSGLINSGVRANGKRVMTIDMATEMAKANGALPRDVSSARIGQLLWARGLHPEITQAPAPHVTMRSEHPNYLWQLDFSVCVLYYLSNGQMGVMESEEFNKNKPANYRRIEHDRLIRGVIVDHYSGAIRVHYHLGSENSQDLIDFFVWAIQKHDGDPMHGVPFVLMMDLGSAGMSQLATNLFRCLQIKVITNRKGNPRAKGAVENAQNLVEMNFESRLRYVGFGSLAELNERAQEWARSYNAAKVHGRHRQPRYAVWMRIASDHLRIAPSIAECRELVITAPVERRVAGDLTISYARRNHGSHTYDVRHVPGIYVGARVRVAVNVYRAPAIDVEEITADGVSRWHTIEPIQRDAAGWRLDAPVIGKEHRAMPDTVADEARKALTKQAYGVDTLDAAEAAKKAKARPYEGRIDAFADVREVYVPDYLPRRGEPLQVDARDVAPVPLTIVGACSRLMQRLGDAYSPKTYGWLEARFGDAGVPEEQLDAIAEQLRQTGLVQATAPVPPTTIGGTQRAAGGAQ